MNLASVTASEVGGTDQLFSAVVARLERDGVRLAGALRAEPPPNGDSGYCHSDLWLLPDGPVVRITQNLGVGSTACRMDAGALEQAVGLAAAQMEAQGADLVVINKFGLGEAEGRGFRSLIVAALGRGVPVLLGVSDTHRLAFERFAEGMATDLRPDEAAILAWCRAAIGQSTCQTEEM